MEIRLAVCLSFLAHGDSVATTGLLFRIGKSTVYSIIPEVCVAIWEVLLPQYLKCPQSENVWLRIANGFEEKWNFPHCVGAVDGKHCRIRAPPRSGSAFHKYKGYFSIVLLAIVDAQCRFISIDVGDYENRGFHLAKRRHRRHGQIASGKRQCSAFGGTRKESCTMSC